MIIIRNQYKNIVAKIKAVYFSLSFKNYVINGASDGGQEYHLGTYRAEERVLEILDEIQDHIEKNETARLRSAFFNSSDAPDTNPFYKVYQMPEE